MWYVDIIYSFFFSVRHAINQKSLPGCDVNSSRYLFAPQSKQRSKIFHTSGGIHFVIMRSQNKHEPLPLCAQIKVSKIWSLRNDQK